jgi:hypothetical protein
MEDLTPRTLRVSDDPEVTTHPNGATGIAAVVVTDSPWAMPVALNQRFTAVFGESDERGVYRCGHVEIWMTPPGGTHDAVTSVRLHGLTQPLVAHNVIIEPAS